MAKLTRRAIIAGSAATAFAGHDDQAAATAVLAGKPAPGVYRYNIGTFELTALYDGIWYRPITEAFIRNATFADVEAALAEAFMPPDKLATPFTTLIVNTGKKLVLIDTGTGGQIAPSAGVLRANLAAAGINPKAVDLIVISHFHPDHINGIKDKDNTASLSQRRDHGTAGARVGLFDGRRQSERGSGGSETDVSQSAPDFLRYRPSCDAICARCGGRVRHRDAAGCGPPRRGTPCLPFIPAINRC